MTSVSGAFLRLQLLSGDSGDALCPVLKQIPLPATTAGPSVPRARFMG